MKISLKFQVPFFVIAFVSAAIAVISILTLRHEKRSLVEVRDRQGKLLVNYLLTIGTDAILSDNKPKLLSFCNNLVAEEKDVKSAMIIDTNRIIYAHNNPSMVGKSCQSNLCMSVLQSEEMTVKPFKHKNDSLFDYSTPLLIGDKRIGSARIIMSNESIILKMAEVKKYIFIISAVLVCISLIVTLLITHLLITVPIKRVTEGIEISASGDFNRRITVKSNNEIGALLKIFNTMNESLLKQKNELFSLYNTLQTLETNQEFNSLVTQSLQVVNNIIGPKQCILGLTKKNNLVIKGISGFESKDSLIGSPIFLPNDIFVKTFQKQVTRKLIASALTDTFNELNIEAENPSEEILLSPLVHGKKSKGIFILIGKKDEREFSDSDREFMDIISLATAMSFSNIELLDKSSKKRSTEPESAIAELVRRILMPQKPFKMKGIEICSYYRPSGETHGNWHGFIEDKENNRLSVFIGDATGEGTPAALAASVANSFIKAMGILKKRYDKLSQIMYRESDLKPDQKEMPITLNPSYLLSLLNQILFNHMYSKQTMTFFASTFDLAKKKIYFANAGHEIPVLIKQTGGLPAALTSSGARLGDTDDTKYDQHTLDLDSGDVIIWYTIGVTQCHDKSNESYGNMRFLRKIRELSSLSAQEICRRIVDDLHSFRKNKTLADDITLVIAKIL